jgi:hypothetical protein
MAGNIKIVKTGMTKYKQTSEFITPKQTKLLNYNPIDRCQHSPFIFYQVAGKYFWLKWSAQTRELRGQIFKTHLSRASKYFCFLISKNIFIE